MPETRMDEHGGIRIMGTYQIHVSQDDDQYGDSPLRWGDDNIRLVVVGAVASEVRDDIAAEVITTSHYYGPDAVREYADSYFPCLCGEEGTPYDHLTDAFDNEPGPVDTDAHLPDCFPMYYSPDRYGFSSASLTDWSYANGAIGFTDQNYGGATDRGRAYLEGSLETFSQWARGEVYVVSLVGLVECDHGEAHTDYLDSIGGVYLDPSKPDSDQIREIAAEHFILPDGVEWGDVEVGNG